LRLLVTLSRSSASAWNSRSMRSLLIPIWTGNRSEQQRRTEQKRTEDRSENMSESSSAA
jgi:hypothetical protein